MFDDRTPALEEIAEMWLYDWAVLWAANQYFPEDWEDRDPAEWLDDAPEF